MWLFLIVRRHLCEGCRSFCSRLIVQHYFRACTSTVYVAPDSRSDKWDSHMWSCLPSTPGAETVVTEKLVQPRTSHVGMGQV